MKRQPLGEYKGLSIYLNNGYLLAVTTEDAGLSVILHHEMVRDTYKAVSENLADFKGIINQ